MKGLVAGVVGVLALTVFERLEWAVLGRRPVYDPSGIARGLAGGRLEDSRKASCWGLGLRSVYGPAIAVTFSSLRPMFPTASVKAGIALGVGIYLFEAATMPAVGATPPFSTWPPADRAMLLVHTSAFGIATTWFLDHLTSYFAEATVIRLP